MRAVCLCVWAFNDSGVVANGLALGSGGRAAEPGLVKGRPQGAQPCGVTLGVGGAPQRRACSLRVSRSPVGDRERLGRAGGPVGP